MRISTFALLTDNLLFTVGVGQLYGAFEGLGIEFTNGLSPVKKALATKETLLETTKTLMGDKDFVKVVKLLATPDKRLELKGYSALDGNYASALFIKNGTSDIGAVWVQYNADGQVTLICFKDGASWLEYYLFSKGLASDYLPSEAIAGTFTKTSLLMYLHLLDCYQQAYLYELMNYRALDGNYIDAENFFGLLQKGSAASDLRWLLPFGIHCGYWSSEGEMNFTEEDLLSLSERGLLSYSGVEGDSQRGFLYGSTALYMGLECAAFKKDTFGIQLKDLSGVVLNGLLIGTAENLHWFDCLNESEIVHHCLDTLSLRNTILKAIES